MPSAPMRKGAILATELAPSQIGPISVLIALVAAVALGTCAQAQPVLVGFAMLAIFPIGALYESTRYRGSHNLIPFELAVVATGAIPIILAGWSGRSVARRYGRRSFWSRGQDERGITSR